MRTRYPTRRRGHLTYDQAKELLGNRDKKKLCNNTWLERAGWSGAQPVYGIRLHSTVVVRLWADDTYSLYMEGWDSVTTRARIRVFSPASVFGSPPRVARILNDPDTAVPFFDGIRVDADGLPITGGEQ
mgnify:CR=1 FL=1